MPHRILRGTRLLITVAALAAVTLVAAGCGPPQYRFVSSKADDVVIKLPRTWTQLRSGIPATTDGSTPAAGSWVAVFDGDPHPSLNHASVLTVKQPVAIARTWVIDKTQGASVTPDELRDIALPVSATARAASAPVGTHFRLIQDEQIKTHLDNGVHVLFSYELGGQVEVFDQVSVLDKAKTRVHLFLVHCTQQCFDSQEAQIRDAVASFTVKIP